MFLCSLVEKLCTKGENDKTGYNFNFGHECTFNKIFLEIIRMFSWSQGIKLPNGNFLVTVFKTNLLETILHFTESKLMWKFPA